ncbi:MAG: desulfoferrodoxin [Candidatus Muiribacterium halophilum]|uniref:Desulfoferrodoxin n=1 Tax=Muiribacterium halophilum TaxID=2053465 RepID=A0A2N5ZFR1_MUIH1|nr:MAG: desulfoferrodoxin [Candidatus Muirbacterium halophilum]
MAKRFEVYKCEMCGNIIEVLHGGQGELVCCGKPMTNMEEKTADQTTEKHVPVVKKEDGMVEVFVGSTEHPMEEKHFIEWVQIIADGKSYRKFLNPGDKPGFKFKADVNKVVAREFCNVHGLWKREE